MKKYIVLVAVMAVFLIGALTAFRIATSDRKETALKMSGIEIVPETPRPQPEPKPAPTVLVQGEEAKPVQETSLVVNFKYKPSN